MGSNLCQKYFTTSPHFFAISCGNRNYKMESLWKQTKNVSHQNNLKDATITLILNYRCCLMLWHKKKSTDVLLFFVFALSLLRHYSCIVSIKICVAFLTMWHRPRPFAVFVFFSLVPIWICGTTLKWTATQQQG